MSTAEEIDDLILGILLNSPHGRTWLKRRGEQAAMEAGIHRLVAAGLDRGVASQLWIAGNPEMVEQMTAMTAPQIEAVNREWSRRTA